MLELEGKLAPVFGPLAYELYVCPSPLWILESHPPSDERGKTP